MDFLIGLTVIVASLQIQSSLALWSCLSDGDCLGLENGVCADGLCTCASGLQAVNGGTICVDVAPYFSSACYEDFQCSRLFPGYQCQVANGSSVGVCRCRQDNHYFHGRCWASRSYGDLCSSSEECQGILRDPYSMSCVDNTCVCAEGYYLRQRGECRRSALGVGEGCVLDVDCQFEGGACNQATFTCYNSADSTKTAVTTEETLSRKSSQNKMAVNEVSEVHKMSAIATRQHNTACDSVTPCPGPFECSNLGVCVCPLGYYLFDNGVSQQCYAELGSPATEDICVTLFAVVIDGICTCPSNFYYQEDMRSCVKPSIRFTDHCLEDATCHTWGSAAVCGPPQEPWALRQCDCQSDQALWDVTLGACRLRAVLGEECEEDSVCMAGDLQILCQADEAEVFRCTCPEGLEALGDLCLTAGLGLNDQCQVSQECSAVENLECIEERCSCSPGYQENGALCAPEIGSACTENADCAITNTVCVTVAVQPTCQCEEDFIEYNSECWPVQSQLNGSCIVDEQCAAGLGSGAYCQNEQCTCAATHHYVIGECVVRVDLFGTCSRQTECYLGELTDRVVCRNGLCQCDFHYPYSEQLRTCSSSTTILGSGLALSTAILILIVQRIFYL